MTGQVDREDRMTRRDVAKLLGMHPDSVSRNLRDGLGSAVTEWGGRGKTMTFSRLMVLRWWRARTCTRRGGRPCSDCSLVVEDSEVVAAHLIEKRHGVFDEPCEEDCGYQGGICQPCM